MEQAKVFINLLKTLDKRAAQLRELRQLSATFDDENGVQLDYAAYNRQICLLQQKLSQQINLQISPRYKFASLVNVSSETTALLNQLHLIKQSLDNCQQRMNSFYSLPTEQIACFIRQSQKLVRQSLGLMGNQQFKVLQANQAIFIAESFQEIYQLQSALNAFRVCLRQKLLSQLEIYCSSYFFLQQLIFRPYHLFSLNYWQALYYRNDLYQQLRSEVKTLDLLSTSILKLNVVAFLSRCQSLSSSTNFSRLEQEAITHLLKEPMVQNQLIALGWFAQADFRNMLDIESIFLQKIKQKVETKKFISDEQKQDPTINIKEYLTHIYTIYKPQAAKQVYATNCSLLEGICYYGKAQLFMRKTHRLKKLFAYEQALAQLKQDVSIFLKYIKTQKVTTEERYLILELINELTGYTQKYELKLAKTAIGNELLGLLNRLNNELHQYQILSLNDTLRNSDTLGYAVLKQI